MKEVTQKEFKKLFLQALGCRIIVQPSRSIDNHTSYSLVDKNGEYCTTSKCAFGMMYKNSEITPELLKRVDEYSWEMGPDINDIRLQEELLLKIGYDYAVTYRVATKKYYVKIYRFGRFDEVNHIHHNSENRALAVYNCYAEVNGLELVKIAPEVLR